MTFRRAEQNCHELMNTTAIFTISSNNYFAFSRTLLESVKKHHDDVDLFFLLVDEEANPQVSSAAAGLCTVLPAQEIGIPAFRKMPTRRG